MRTTIADALAAVYRLSNTRGAGSMRLIHNVQRHTSARRCRWGSVGISLLVCALLFPARMQAQAPTPTPERELSNAFRRVAQQAVPAVVFITVETAVATQHPGPFNKPFDWFGEDFMERFF